MHLLELEGELSVFQGCVSVASPGVGGERGEEGTLRLLRTGVTMHCLKRIWGMTRPLRRGGRGTKAPIPRERRGGASNEDTGERIGAPRHLPGTEQDGALSQRQTVCPSPETKEEDAHAVKDRVGTTSLLLVNPTVRRGRG